MSVDLPAPFSPHSPWISPRLTWMDTSLSAVTPGNCFVTREISRRASSGTSTSSERPGPRGRARHVNGYALLLGRRIRDVLVDTLVRLESGIDDQLLEVRLGDLEDLEELAGHLALLLVVTGEIGELEFGEAKVLLALCELDRELAGERGQLAGVLEDRDGELTAGDGVAAGLGGVLTGDGDLAGQAGGLHGLEGAQGGAVVGGDHRLELLAGGGEDVLHELLGVGWIPVLHPLIGDDLDLAGLDERVEDLHLALPEQVGGVVGGASAEGNEIARVLHGQAALGLGGADVGG